MSIEDLIKLIMNRDNISYNEACYLVEDCQCELNYIVSHGGSYDEAAEAVYLILGLEPDYMDVLLDF